MIIKSKFSSWAFGLGAALLLAGCASVSVDQKSAYAVPQMPQQIYVMGFDTTQGTWKVDRQGYELQDFQQNLQGMLSTGIATDITSKLLLPANIISDPSMLGSQNAWVITGQFVRVNQGSRLLRATVGLGAGETKLETVVRVYDLQQGFNQQPFLTFTTDGGSGAMPGGVESLGLAGAAIKSAAGAAKGLSQDTGRTARMITAEISKYMYNSGWIPKSMYIKPKTN